jgi:GT2 family glycosyltransferase
MLLKKFSSEQKGSSHFNMKKIFISILNFNSRNETIDCLNSIKKIKIEGFSVTVVLIDNASKEKMDLTEGFINPIELKIIENKENFGFAGGHNIGLRYALEKGADYVLVLNNDAVLGENALLEMFLAAESISGVGIVVPKIYFAKGHEFHKGKYGKEDLGKVFWYAGGEVDWKNVVGFHRGVDEVDRGQYDIQAETNYATGCCMLLRREVLEKVGLFDDNYYLYYEDGDLSQRVKRHDYKIIYEPKAVVYHENAGSSGGSGSNLQDYYISRNRMLFGFKYAPARAKLALFRESLRILKSGREWQKRGIWDFYKRKFGKGSFNP